MVESYLFLVERDRRTVVALRAARDVRGDFISATHEDFSRYADAL
jgi:hypothetical protein